MWFARLHSPTTLTACKEPSAMTMYSRKCPICNNPILRIGRKTCSITHDKKLAAQISHGKHQIYRDRRKCLWKNIEEIRKIYKNCREMTKQTGILHEVDHIVPLHGKNVCGLHVEYNLQIITSKQNRIKSNKFP